MLGESTWSIWRKQRPLLEMNMKLAEGKNAGSDS